MHVHRGSAIVWYRQAMAKKEALGKEALGSSSAVARGALGAELCAAMSSGDEHSPPCNVARVTHDFCGEQAGHPGGHPGLLTNRPVEALPGGLLCPHAAVQSPGRLEEDVPPAQVSPLQPLSPPCPLEFLDEAREFEQHVAKFLRDLVASSASEAVRLIPEFPAYIQAMSLSTAIDRMVAGLHSVKRGGLDCKDEVDVFSPQPPHHHETWLARNCSNSKCCPH